jgi:uncharacterized protein YdaU (DUF1376 family)
MSDEVFSFNGKVDVFMPLYIGRYLQDTSHLSAEQSGAYLHLLMFIWIRGPLPNDPAILARIARLSDDAWSIHQALLMQFLSIGPDGMLHQRGAERLKALWMDKRLKAHEKAKKAAQTRWSKQRAKGGVKPHAPSIAQALPEQCPTSEVQVQKQKTPTPTPPAARKGMHAAAVPIDQGKSERKEKPAKLAPVGLRNGRKDAEHHQARTNGATAEVNGSNGHSKNGTHPANGDRRHDAVKHEVLDYWKAQNPDRPNLPWTKLEEKALLDLLERDPHLSVAELRRCLKHRAQSEVNPSSLPHKWLRSVVEYHAGPLERFNRPVRAARVL